MAKSIRSKSGRKNRAIKRENIFKPVADARVQRLAAREALSLTSQDHVMIDSPSVHPSAGLPDTLEGLVGKERRRSKWSRKQKQPFNAYGLSSKELMF